MSDSLFARFLLVLAALAVGCVPDPGDPAPTSNDDDSTSVSELFAVAGQWVQPDGEPVEGISVTVSTEACIADVTDSAGVFRVLDVSPGPKRLITYGSTAEYRWPSVAFAFEAPDDGDDFSFSAAMTLPTLDVGVSVDMEATDTQTVGLGVGAELSFNAGALQLAPLADPLLRSGSIPPASATWFSDLPQDTLAVFAAEPILSRFEPAAHLRLPVEGTGAGDRLALWSIDYATGLFVQEATLLVDDEGVASTDSGGLVNLGWHALAPVEETR